MRSGPSCIHNSSMSSPGVTLTIWSLFSLFIGVLYHPKCVYSLELKSKPTEITPPVATASHATTSLLTGKEGQRAVAHTLGEASGRSSLKITLFAPLICTLICQPVWASCIIEAPSTCSSWCPHALKTSLAESDSCACLLPRWWCTEKPLTCLPS